MMENQNNKDKLTVPSNSKEIIIQTALVEFAKYGLSGARVDRIAKNAKVNKAMIYYYFSSKENLYNEVIKRHLVDKIAQLRYHLAQNDNLKTALEGFVDTYAKAFGGDRNMISIILRELAQPDSKVVITMANILKESGLPEQFLKMLSKEMENGTIRSVNREQTLVSFITMNLGYYLIAPIINQVLNIDNRQQFIEQRKKAIVDLFLKGVMV
ncbi:MAG: TetR/AcrR family transcriptional regulator [FCB group bacterium]|nr:TetR/AcrR family transcriptional regulator [FCB group bacterium]